jgi:hypothetical protein
VSENWKIQVSPKTPGGALINIRAENGDELRRGLAFVRDHAQEILDTEALLAGAQVVVAAGLTAAPEPPQFVPAPPQAPAQAPSSGPACKHGPMQFRESKPGAAKAWRAYFCPTPKGTPDQCEPQWIKG